MASTFTSMFDQFERRAEQHPDVTCLSFQDRAWSWGQMRNRILKAAGALEAMGVKAGDRIAFIDKNHAACLELALAASLIGAAQVVVNFRLSLGELGYVLGDSDAKLLITGHEFLPQIRGIQKQLPALNRVLVLGGENDEYEALVEGAPPLERRHRAEPDDCFLQLYTSGTTGWPKGALLTQKSMSAHNETVRNAYDMDDSAVNLVAMPLFHVGGTSWALAGMAAGARTVLVREVNAAHVLDRISHEHATHAFFVPAVIQMLLAEENVVDATASLRVIGYGGSPMPAPLMERILTTLRTPLYSVYGMTEMSGVFCVLGPDEHRDPERKYLHASAGRAVPGVEVRVVDPSTGEDVPTGDVGEFWLRSEQAMSGYWHQPDASEAAFVDGWLRTGDAGRLDDDGYLFIEDRVKDMVISGGENIYPAEVERVLVEHPAVEEVAIIGIPHQKWGETVHAVVTTRDGQSTSERELIDYCRERLAHYKCPTGISFAPALPRNPTGKLLKRKLREDYGGLVSHV
jgi:acyl-CoA synthetase (AMP-forming)/AMP-acid ligase II